MILHLQAALTQFGYRVVPGEDGTRILELQDIETGSVIQAVFTEEHASKCAGELAAPGIVIATEMPPAKRNGHGPQG